MDRMTLIQYLVDKHNYQTYLEIGVQKGFSFFPIKCKKKIAVDPKFLFDWKNKFYWILKNAFNVNNSYFEITSDDFFSNHKYFLNRLSELDIVFVDGLHTFKATLQDILNSLKYLKKGGTIVAHDCYPPHEAASIYAENAELARLKGINLPSWNEEWCGDSWKAIAYLKVKYTNTLKIKVLNTDYGLGTVQFQGDNNLNLAIDQELFEKINLYEYKDLMKNPIDLIGLVDKDFYKHL